MSISNLLKQNDLKFREEEYEDSINIYTIGETKRIIVVEISEKGSDFILDRDLFYYLDNQREPYAFALRNLKNDTFYYLEFFSKMNWLQASFNRSDKQRLHFGKIVLNSKTDESSMINKITTYVNKH